MNIKHKLRIKSSDISDKKRLLIASLIQLFIPYVSLFSAFLLRLDLNFELLPIEKIFLWGSILALLRLAFLVFFSAHRGLWRYVSITDLIGVIKSSSISSIVFIFVIYFINNFDGFPRSVFILEWGIYIFYSGGIRIIIRMMRENLRKRGYKEDFKNVAIIGAGDAGAAFCSQVKSISNYGIKPIIFFDDDSEKIGMTIMGIKVVGSIDEINDFANLYNIELIVIAIPSATSKEKSRIIEICRKSNIEFRILPGTNELLEGNVSVSKLRKLEVEDLLGRDETNLDEISLNKFFNNKSILITGAAGTIGSELVRRVIKFSPSKIILVDRAENNLVLLEHEINSMFLDQKENIDIITLIVDISNNKSVSNLIQNYKPQIILHAAAHKHVNLMEKTPIEAVRNNIGGILNLTKNSIKENVDKFVLVSSDKAVEPTNVMGATKRISEMIISQMKDTKNTKFTSVRFGNVLGSDGSVVPIFQKQIEQGGPVTVTDPKVNRFFMTAHEAAGLILSAAEFGNNKEIFLLDMGKPINISFLAKTMIELSGFIPNKDIEIVYTGLKPGEKISEDLSYKNEKITKTKHEKIFSVENNNQEINVEEIEEFLENLENFSEEEVKTKLKNFI